MKKTLSVVIALAMVLVMTVSAFAAEKPADANDAAAWTAYYTELLTDTDKDPIDLAGEIVADISTGAVDQNVAVNALESVALTMGSDVAKETLNVVFDFLGISGETVLPDVLPEDDEVSCIEAGIEGILDSIFGVIGDIAAMLFGEETSDYCFRTTTTTTTTTTTEPVEDVPELGDNSLIALGAVALVAGAALVLTRKKDKDAE